MMHKKPTGASPADEIMRVRKPHPDEGEIFGIVTALLGGSRLRVSCIDGKERIIRIPGRLKRQAWIKTGDVILLVPWEIDNTKGDVTWRYTRIQVEWLRSRGILPREFGV
jgi:translation initiation factor 1A